MVGECSLLKVDAQLDCPGRLTLRHGEMNSIMGEAASEATDPLSDGSPVRCSTCSIYGNRL